MQNKEVSEFGIILLFLIAGALFVFIGYCVNWVISPSRPNYQKLTAYECGEEAEGNAWGQFNMQYYIIALVFVLFDVELVFLFPWAIVFGQKELIEATNGAWAWFALVEMFIFVGILVVALVYAWVKGYLDWVKPIPKPSDYLSKIPKSMYEKVNERY